MTNKQQCATRIYGQRGGDYPCQKPAKIEREGKWYCKVHDPEYIKEKREKWKTDFDKKFAEDSLRWDRTDAMRRACEGLTTEELNRVTPELIRDALATKAK